MYIVVVISWLPATSVMRSLCLSLCLFAVYAMLSLSTLCRISQMVTGPVILCYWRSYHVHDPSLLLCQALPPRITLSDLSLSTTLNVIPLFSLSLALLLRTSHLVNFSWLARLLPTIDTVPLTHLYLLLAAPRQLSILPPSNSFDTHGALFASTL